MLRDVSVRMKYVSNGTRNREKTTKESLPVPMFVKRIWYKLEKLMNKKKFILAKQKTKFE